MQGTQQEANSKGGVSRYDARFRSGAETRGGRHTYRSESYTTDGGVGWLGRFQNSARTAVFELTWLIWECDRCVGFVVFPGGFRYSGEGGDWADKYPWWGVIKCRLG